ncbi:MAG TPA: hypothetical protein PKU97_19100 [Kofleriaceae bacterium]|nr:hypothetical protein [Kofleriaceae bacterium]
MIGGLAASLAGCFVGPDHDPVPLSNLFVQPSPLVDYTIEDGQAFYIDKSYTVGHLTIRGKLFCRHDLVEPITITATTITVAGPRRAL